VIIRRKSAVPCFLSSLILACSAGETAPSGGSLNVQDSGSSSSNDAPTSFVAEDAQQMMVVDAPPSQETGGGGGMDAPMMPEATADAAPTVTVYDLKTDWSDTKNPNGVWSIMIGTNVAKSVMNWNGSQGQAAYATSGNGNGHIPVLLKVSVNGFEADQAQKGDLIVHAQDEQGGPGLGQARIVWTAPSTGTVDIDGSLWLGRISLRRSDDYTLTVAGTQKAMGKVPYNMGINRTSPVKISQKALPIMKGETVELQISRSMMCDASPSTCAEFCDLTLGVTLTSP